MNATGATGGLTGIGLSKTATDIQGRDVLKVLESADANKVQNSGSGSSLTGLGQKLDIKT